MQFLNKDSKHISLAYLPVVNYFILAIKLDPMNHLMGIPAAKSPREETRIHRTSDFTAIPALDIIGHNSIVWSGVNSYFTSNEFIHMGWIITMKLFHPGKLSIVSEKYLQLRKPVQINSKFPCTPMASIWIVVINITYHALYMWMLFS